jgi:hypothetical protein
MQVEVTLLFQLQLELSELQVIRLYQQHKIPLRKLIFLVESSNGSIFLPFVRHMGPFNF